MASHDLSLAGSGIRLDPIAATDARELVQLIDEELWRGMPTPTPRSAEDYQQIIAMLQAAPGLLAFVVRDATTGEARGTTAFYDLVPEQGRVEIGWTWYARRYWGGPTNPGTKLLLLQHAFDTLKLNRVALRCDVRNTRSAAAITRLGATHEGVLRQHRIAADGVVSDTAYFSIVRSEWSGVRAGLLERLRPLA